LGTQTEGIVNDKGKSVDELREQLAGIETTDKVNALVCDAMDTANTLRRELERLSRRLGDLQPELSVRVMDVANAIYRAEECAEFAGWSAYSSCVIPKSETTGGKS
jgi:hypothetical protein